MFAETFEAWCSERAIVGAVENYRTVVIVPAIASTFRIHVVAHEGFTTNYVEQEL